MRNLKIGKKLFVTFGIIILLFITTVIASIFCLVTISSNFTSFFGSHFPVTNTASELRASIQSFSKNVGYSMMTDDDQEAAIYIQNAENQISAMKESVEFMRVNFGEPELVDKFDQAMKSTRNTREQVMKLSLASKNTEASKIYFDEVEPVLNNALSILTKINDTATELATEEYNASMLQKNIVMFILLVLSIVALIVTIFLAIYITLGLTKPIKELEDATQKIAEGNMNAIVTYKSKDELGSLSESMRTTVQRLSSIITDLTYIIKEIANGNFNLHTKVEQDYVGDFRPLLLTLRQMNTDLSNTIHHINQSADQVASGSDQVATSSQVLSQGATEQASSIEELAATINEISEQVRRNAQNAKEVSEKSVETREQIIQSDQWMKNMLQAMDEITESSIEIGKIIKTIEDIAFQTNILALNAAVEATRAGDAGKGFAFVADEVRKVASKSSEASKNISALIENSLNSVERGVKIADETAQALQEVVEGAKIITEKIEEISQASNEQAASIAQVTQGIDQISSVVQTNSATAEESAAASEELYGQAQMLKNLISKFRLKVIN